MMTPQLFYKLKREQKEKMETLLKEEQKEQFEKEMNFVRTILKESLNEIFKEKSVNHETVIIETIELWKTIYNVYAGRTRFNIGYLYDCLNNYIDHCLRLNLKYDPCITLAIILQRIGGKLSHFTQNADIAYNILTKNFGVYADRAASVKDYILSSISLDCDPSNNYKKKVIRDVYLFHLGETWFEFQKIQDKVYSERTFLTRLEFYKCQLEICNKLLNLKDGIFASAYYKNKYEVNALRNLRDYREVVEEKIKTLEINRDIKNKDNKIKVITMHLEGEDYSS